MRIKGANDYRVAMASKMDSGNGIYFIGSAEESVYFVEIIKRILLRRGQRVLSSLFRTDKSI